jgi:acetolactate decarboxylase
MKVSPQRHWLFSPLHFVLIAMLSLCGASCGNDSRESDQFSDKDWPEVKITGAMKRVMWEGKLDGLLHFDTLSDQSNLYGLGPLAGLRGEITIDAGQVYVSRVTSDTTMEVIKTNEVSAPFFVRAQVTDWQETQLPDTVRSIQQLEEYLIDRVNNRKDPFPFKLTGTIDSAFIHVQNLPPGTNVSSPKEAHQGQTNYRLGSQEVSIIGFYSQKHQGIFTHHDSYLHLHLITEDESQMGHLDRVSFGTMQLFLPGR